MNVKVQCGKVTTEGDSLYFEIRGQGQPLLFIPGGGGDGNLYSLVANILSKDYKVITYDRRASARSTMNQPEKFDISQESRDAVAIIDAAGEASAIVFGNSTGAVIALDLAINHPESVRSVVLHEPPIACMHPDTNKWKKFFAKVYLTSFRFGGSLAMLRFIIGVGLLDYMKAVKVISKSVRKDEPRISSKASADYFAKQELLPVSNYLPNFKKLKENRVKIFVAAGEMSLAKKRFYAQTVPVLSEKIGCEMVIFPGHHGSFMDLPDKWAYLLKQTIQKANEDTSRK